MLKNLRPLPVLTCLTFALSLDVSFAQVPGDGVPDVYLVVPGGETFLTSLGQITRPVGTILVDTDETVMVAVAIEGPNLLLTTPDNGDFLVGSTLNLQNPIGPPPFAPTWTVEYLDGRTQWELIDPNTGGFSGVIGEYSPPCFGCPRLGLAFFDGDPAELLGNAITYATSESGIFATNPQPGQLQMGGVTPTVPEPATISLLAMAILGLRRRRVCN